IFNAFVLSPRVDNEWLKPYKAFFQEKTEAEQIEKFRKNPGSLVAWIKASIVIDHDANYSRTPLTPTGCFELRAADPQSADILFVAMCRSFGIPSRLESGTRVPQYLVDGTWKDVFFERPPDVTGNRGTLLLSADPGNEHNPEYYTHYTIEKFSDGFFRSLDYETDPQVKEFPCALRVAPGYYILVTGNRIQDGTVLTSLQTFNISEENKTDVKISLRKNVAPVPVMGVLDLRKFLPEITGINAIRADLKKGAILAFLDPEKEPSKHFIADLKTKKQEFSSWKGMIILFFPDEKKKTDFRAKNESELTPGIQYAVVKPNAMEKLYHAIKGEINKRLPLIIYLNKKGEVNYLSEGYHIGTGDDLRKLINK
ncbi:MAG: transglutaminase-like domain-containing protein, partial [Bacteroidota bacterium]